jgi:NAD(P)-dependent dehydrogenase (short-subunit alcohol dehydrogenase family)
MARSELAALADVTDADSPQAAVAAASASAEKATPALAVLASDRPARFTAADALLLSQAWPLMPIVSVASSLVDGRRRSGPQLPGVDEVPWHDLPGRCGWWLAAFEAGLPTSLGLPATARREERLEDLVRSVAVPMSHLAGDICDPEFRSRLVATAADRLGGIDGVVAAAGGGAIGRFQDLAPDTFARIMDLDFTAPAELVRAALPALVRGDDPVIVFIGSILAGQVFEDDDRAK